MEGESVASERATDPRLRTTLAELPGLGLPAGTQLPVWLLDRAPLSAGAYVDLAAPNVPVLYLFKAKEARDAAEPARRDEIKRQLLLPQDDSIHASGDAHVYTLIAELVTATLLSYAAVEAHLNHMIDRLPDTAMVEIVQEVNGVEISVMRGKGPMRWFSTSAKLDRVAPLFSGRPSIKGTGLWQQFVTLRRLRDGLVHPKIDQPLARQEPSAMAQLLRGDGSDAPESAARIVDAIEPGYMSDDARIALGLADEASASSEA